jgi:cobalt-zinc-cadmium efflux system protein
MRDGAFYFIATEDFGLVIMLTHRSAIDPLISFVIVAAIIKGATPVLRESIEILMESAPRHVKTGDVLEGVRTIPGVRNVHDVHLWTLKPGITILTCHVLVDGGTFSQQVLTAIRRKIALDRSVQHMNIQIETSCCHPETMHCNIDSLIKSHPDLTEVTGH